MRARLALLEAHAHCAVFAAGAGTAAARELVRSAQAPHARRLAALWAALLQDWAALGAGDPSAGLLSKASYNGNPDEGVGRSSDGHAAPRQRSGSGTADSAPGLGAEGDRAPCGSYRPHLLMEPVGPVLPALLPYLARAALPAMRALALFAADGGGEAADGDAGLVVDRATAALLLDVCMAVMRDATAALASQPAGRRVGDGSLGTGAAPGEPRMPQLSRPGSAGGRRCASSSSGTNGAAVAAAADEAGGLPHLGLARGPPDGAPPLPVLAAAVGALRVLLSAMLEGAGAAGKGKAASEELLDTSARLELAERLEQALVQVYCSMAPCSSAEDLTPNLALPQCLFYHRLFRNCSVLMTCRNIARCIPRVRSLYVVPAVLSCTSLCLLCSTVLSHLCAANCMRACTFACTDSGR